MSLQHRLSEVVEAKTEGEQLYLAYQDLKQQERFLADQLKAVRQQIEQKMELGEYIGFPDAYLAYQDSTRYEVDQEKAKETLGQEVWSRVSEVSGSKLKDALKIGLVTQKEFDSICTPKVTRSLVPKTTPKH